jgi:Protein of unknown function (DUF3800)
MTQLIEVESTSLLVFIDETGEELFQDPQFPLFGLGGCVVPGAMYLSKTSRAWLDLKQCFFGGFDQPLHAASIDMANISGIEALGEFFREHAFSRIAVALTHSTELPESLEPFQVASISLLNRLVEVVRWWQGISDIVLVVEQSERGDRLARKFLSDFRYWREIGGKKRYLPVRQYFVAKSVGEPGLEIADFVMHAVGGRTRARLQGGRRERADFKAIFDDVDQRLVSFAEIKRADLTATAPNPRAAPGSYAAGEPV